MVEFYIYLIISFNSFLLEYIEIMFGFKFNMKGIVYRIIVFLLNLVGMVVFCYLS